MTRITVVGDTLRARDRDGRVERSGRVAPVRALAAVAARARPGGAGLAAALAAADGHEVTLVTALSLDDSGRHLASLLEAADVEVVDIGLASPTPVKVRLRCEDRLLLRVDHAGVTGKPGEATPAASEAIRPAASWIGTASCGPRNASRGTISIGPHGGGAAKGMPCSSPTTDEV